MTAICKTKLIHGTNLQPLLNYGENQEKTSFTDNALQDTLDYAANPLKTLANLEDGEKELLVSGILCEPETALLDFAALREKYLEIHGPERIYRYEYFDRRTGETRPARRDPVTAIHLIQSFSERGLDPRTVHQIGLELCNRLGVMAVVDTHMNTDHLHNHIIINAYKPGGERKFVAEKETILQIRELSDQLQREYGIPLTFAPPREQLYQAKGRDTYGEWKAKGQGISWKEIMKDEMTAAQGVSDSREEFIALMEDFGYTIARQEPDSVTWWNKDHTRKIRDRTLGDAYELCKMFPDNTPLPDRIAEQNTRPQKHTHLSLARYDWNGRRRSDLELLIRKAIAIIRHMGSRYHYRDNPVATARTVNSKLENMELAIDIIKNMGLENKEGLKDRMNDVGARLSHVKSSTNSLEGKRQLYDTAASLIASLENIGKTLASVQYWPGGKMPDLMPKQYTPEEIAKERAAISPMSGAQKRELYLKLRAHPEVTLAGKGFSEVSSIEAEEIFAYFKGRQERPACLKDSVQVTMDNVYQKRNARIRAKLVKPIQKYQRKHLEELLHSHGLSADMDALTQYDAINIESCLGANPFSESPIDADRQHTLSQRLQNASLSTSRDIQYILPGEYDAIMDYLDGVRQAKPAILKPSVRIDDITAQKLQVFMDAKGISCSIPVSSFSKSDYQKMYGHVLGQGQIPDCASRPQSTQDKTADFHKLSSVQKLTDKKQLLVTQYRNLLNQLQKLGFSPIQLETVKTEIAAFREEYAHLKNERLALSEEYKKMIWLDHQITYAESPSFLFGPLFNSRVHSIPDIIEKEERDHEPGQGNPQEPAQRENRRKDIDLEL